MAKFCSNCGNQISDNAKFCTECGAKLGDYTSGGAGIEGMIQRSLVGAASVGKVEISPTIKTTAIAAGGYACRICGSPATAKCDHCRTYTCGKCLKKVYSVSESDIEANPNSKTIEQIKSTQPIFFCKECIETYRINRQDVFLPPIKIGEALDDFLGETHVFYEFLGLWIIVGYFTESELQVRICEKCKSFFAPFQCKHCGKMFCYACLARKSEIIKDLGKSEIIKYSLSVTTDTEFRSCPECNPDCKKA